MADEVLEITDEENEEETETDNKKIKENTGK